MAGLKKANQSNDLEKVNSELDAEEVRHLDLDSPMADEDGVVRDVPLLAGYIDEDGTLYDTFSYREMNGKDEEAISKADVRSNPAKLANVLCERCVVAIGTITKKEVGVVKWGKIIRSMLGGDIDYMMFKIRELSKGTEVEFRHTCPSCGHELVTIMNTDEFEIKPFMGERDIHFELIRGYRDRHGDKHMTGVLSLPTGYDREATVPSIKKNPAMATTVLLSRLMKFDDGAVVSQNLVAEMSLRDRDMLEKLLKENTFGIDTTVDNLICDNCGAVIHGQVGESNFF